jgi:hypothetical protein
MWAGSGIASWAVEVEAAGVGLRGEGTRGRDQWVGGKKAGSWVGLRWAGRLLKARGRTGKAGRGMGRGMGHGVEVSLSGESGLGSAVVGAPVGKPKRGGVLSESVRTRGGRGADAGAGAGDGGDSRAEGSTVDGALSTAAAGAGAGAGAGSGAGAGAGAGDISTSVRSWAATLDAARNFFTWASMQVSGCPGHSSGGRESSRRTTPAIRFTTTWGGTGGSKGSGMSAFRRRGV